MRRMAQRWHRAATRLGLVATAGVMFQTTGCSVDPAQLAADFTSMFVNTLITTLVNDRFGVTSSLFF